MFMEVEVRPEYEGDCDIGEDIFGQEGVRTQRSKDFGGLLRRAFLWLGHDVRVWATYGYLCRAISPIGDEGDERHMKHVANTVFMAFFLADCNSDKALEELIASGFLPTPD